MLYSFSCQFDIAQNQLEKENLKLDNFLDILACGLAVNNCLDC